MDAPFWSFGVRLIKMRLSVCVCKRRFRWNFEIYLHNIFKRVNCIVFIKLQKWSCKMQCADHNLSKRHIHKIIFHFVVEDCPLLPTSELDLYVRRRRKSIIFTSVALTWFVCKCEYMYVCCTVISKMLGTPCKVLDDFDIDFDSFSGQTERTARFEA